MHVYVSAHAGSLPSTATAGLDVNGNPVELSITSDQHQWTTSMCVCVYYHHVIAPVLLAAGFAIHVYRRVCVLGQHGLDN